MGRNKWGLVQWLENDDLKYLINLFVLSHFFKKFYHDFDFRYLIRFE